MEEQDLLQALSWDDGGESRTEETALCSRPRRCWEYMNNSPGTECQACVVFKTHATWWPRLRRVGNHHGVSAGTLESEPAEARA